MVPPRNLRASRNRRPPRRARTNSSARTGTACANGKIRTASRDAGPFTTKPAATAPEAAAPEEPKTSAAKYGPGVYAHIITNHGTMIAKLFDKEAPKTVENFVMLAEGKKQWRNPRTNTMVRRPNYNNLTFHRIIPGFMIQGGDPEGTGMGGPGFTFADEFNAKLRHNKAGILSMANRGPDTNGGQFFITLVPTPHLDDRHSVFGELVEGLDTLRGDRQSAHERQGGHAAETGRDQDRADRARVVNSEQENRRRSYPPVNNPKIAIVVGAGFAGLTAAKALANHEGLRVILVDRRNHHLFQPLLYQVATAGLNPSDIAVPIRVQFRDAPNVEIHLGHVDGVDLEKHVIFGEGHEIGFDYLILACGARHSYFGHPEWEEFAPGLKTLEQATEMRRRMLVAFEHAENERDPDAQRAYLTFVVVGAGPTGVELAGAIADISRTAMRGDFRRIDPSKAHIVLLEAAPRVLTAFSDELSERARRDLAEIGVEVRTNAKVEAIDAQGVTIGSRRLAARTVFWAAGVQAERLKISPPLDADRASRIKVGSDYSVPGYPNVFVVGDMASLEMAPGLLVPGVAPAAIQGGEHAARMILRDLVGDERRPFVYIDKGTMATIGKSRAVGQDRPGETDRPHRLVRVAVHPRVSAHWIPKSPRGALQLGVELHVLQARRAVDH